jgi:ornithine cyclodeaminase/alanine dehydrogenase-like protein (mu-crystallin family)
MHEAIDLVEQGYREAQAYPIINAPRRRVHSKSNVRVSSFPGGVGGLGVIGGLMRADKVWPEKSNQGYAYREHPVYALWDSDSGQLLSIMMGEITEKTIGFSSIMALRTGATSGVAFRYLARKDTRTAGVFGAGGQALHKILALKCVRDLRTVKIFSRNPENRRKFAKRVEEMFAIDAIPVDAPREAVEGVDVVICATNSNVPVFDWSAPTPRWSRAAGWNRDGARTTT